jgi:hypothetical protein
MAVGGWSDQPDPVSRPRCQAGFHSHPLSYRKRAGSRDCTGEICTNPAPAPPGPHGAPGRGQARAGQRHTHQEPRPRNRQELKKSAHAGSVSLNFQLPAAPEEPSAVHKLFAGVSVTTFANGLSVVHSSGSTSGTYTRDDGSLCQELVMFPPELKRTLPMRKWTTAGRIA